MAGPRRRAGAPLAGRERPARPERRQSSPGAPGALLHVAATAATWRLAQAAAVLDARPQRLVARSWRADRRRAARDVVDELVVSGSSGDPGARAALRAPARRAVRRSRAVRFTGDPDRRGRDRAIVARDASTRLPELPHRPQRGRTVGDCPTRVRPAPLVTWRGVAEALAPRDYAARLVSLPDSRPRFARGSENARSDRRHVGGSLPWIRWKPCARRRRPGRARAPRAARRRGTPRGRAGSAPGAAAKPVIPPASGSGGGWQGSDDRRRRRARRWRYSAA